MHECSYCCYLHNILKHKLQAASMLEDLKLLLANSCQLQPIISLLSRPSFLYSLTPAHLQELTQVVESKAANPQLHPKVATAIYSILIMKGQTQYNTKLAIETLTKYYRQLYPSTTPTDEAVGPSTTISIKTRHVLANLLMRIPNFSNYKLIIKDINPQLLPLSVILRHRAHIYKQCPNLYKEYLIGEHKYVWHRLLEGDEENYPLTDDICAVRLGLQKMVEASNLPNLHSTFAEIQKLLALIRNRLEDTCQSEVNLEQLSKQLESIFFFKIPASGERRLLPPQTLLALSKHVRLIKSSCLQILRQMVAKFGYSMWRKFLWLTDCLHSIFISDYDQSSILPSYLIDFFSTLLEVFGLGFFGFDKLVKDEGLSCLSALISALCFNDYSGNNKQETAVVNYQQGKNRKKNDIHIKLYNSTVVECTYEAYLKTTNKMEREALLCTTLKFLSSFYWRKSQAGMEFYQGAELLSILATSKNALSRQSIAIIAHIRDRIFFKGYEHIGDHIQQFCHDVFQTYIRKKKDRKFELERCFQVLIEPTGRNEQPAGKSGGRDRESQLRRTNSFEMEFEGWSQQKQSRKSKEKGEKSEMFYSIKQCSVIDENEGGKIEQREEENEFILTPQF